MDETLGPPAEMPKGEPAESPPENKEAVGRSSTKEPRNAFTELMKPKPKEQHDGEAKQSQKLAVLGKLFQGKDGLGVYLANPGAHPKRVIYYNADFVAIHDKFPKSLVHMLLLPRHPVHSREHPYEAFQGAAFLTKVKEEAARMKTIAAKELRRLVGAHSAADAPRNAVLNGEVDHPPPGEDGAPSELPTGRDWEADIKVGVHTCPSMNHLHVHVFSREMGGPWLKRPGHYLSFNSEFLVDLDDFPLTEAEQKARAHNWKGRDVICWRCGANEGHNIEGPKFEKFKLHLAQEQEEWKRE